MIDIFAESIKSPHTRDEYIHALKRFKNGAKITRELDTIKPEILQTKLIEFIVAQKKAGKSYSTQNMIVNAVQKYCDVFDIELKWKKVRAVMSEQHTNRNDTPYSLEQLKTLVNAGDIRKKAIILGLVATGARVEGFSKLTLRDLTDYKNVFKVTIDSGTNQEYYTFTTIEATSAIKTYLKYRKDAGEILKPTSPLIRQEFAKKDANKVKPLRVIGVSQIVYGLLVKHGLRVIGNKFERQQTAMCHGFRKYFNSALVRSGAKQIVVETLLGHGIGLQANYLRLSVDEVYAEYVKAENQLTVFSEAKLQQELIATQHELATKTELESKVAELTETLKDEKLSRDEWDTKNVIPMLNALKQNKKEIADLKQELERLKARK